LISEAPGLKILAVAFFQTNLEQLAINVCLLFVKLIGPSCFALLNSSLSSLLKVFLALDINLSEMNSQSKLIESFDIRSDTFKLFVIKSKIHMQLEAHTSNTAVPFFKALDHIVNFVRLFLIVANHGLELVIIVEKFSIWVSLMSVLESQTHKVINLFVWAIIVSLVVSFTNSFVDNIPGINLSLELLNSGCDVVFHECFDLVRIILSVDVLRRVV
jgi:hypothetical protein